MLNLDDCRKKAPPNTKPVCLTLEGGMSIEILLFASNHLWSFFIKWHFNNYIV